MVRIKRLLTKIRQNPRYFWYIRVGGCSLFKAGARFAKEFGKENIQITLVVDRLSEKGMAQYREAAAAAGLSFDVVGICLSPLGWTMSEALHRSELSPGTSLLKDNKQL